MPVYIVAPAWELGLGALGRTLRCSRSGRRLGRWSLGATEERRRRQGFLGHVWESKSSIQVVMLYLFSWELFSAWNGLMPKVLANKWSKTSQLQKRNCWRSSTIAVKKFERLNHITHNSCSLTIVLVCLHMFINKVSCCNWRLPREYLLVIFHCSSYFVRQKRRKWQKRQKRQKNKETDTET